MLLRPGMMIPAVMLVALLCPGASRLLAAVNLEWRPLHQTVEVGDVVEIALYAVSSTGSDESIMGIQAVLLWDPTQLALLGNVNPCQGSGMCPDNAYDWFASDFAPHDLNATFEDGNAFYVAFARFPGERAWATDEGLWVTTFEFEALCSAHAELSLERTFGSTRTVVVGGQTGDDVTGELGPPAEIVIMACPAPAVWAVGCRYLAITPAASLVPIALLISGEVGDPAVACVSAYVQADGTLGPIPVFLMPDEWGMEGTVYVADLEIAPSEMYDVQAACGQGGVVESLSIPTTGTTWLWGDANDSGFVDHDDFMLVLNGSRGHIPEGTILENLDLAPCVPDRLIDELDVTLANAAFTGACYPCLVACPDAGDFADFLPCMAGPGTALGAACGRFDINSDAAVDLADFAVFQAGFWSPPH